jgi:transcriptional regulator with XRE-family HTH domain
MSTVEHVVAKIVSWRNEHEVNQAEFARAMREFGCKWHQSTLSRLEKGGRDVSLTEAIAIAEIMGVTLLELIA